MDLLKVTLVDSGHNIRGSWGDTRALHATMEDDVRIKVETSICRKINVVISNCFR